MNQCSFGGCALYKSKLYDIWEHCLVTIVAGWVNWECLPLSFSYMFPDKLDVCGSVRHSTMYKEKMQQDATIYQNFIIPYLYEAQHVSGDTLPIIRSLKLHWQPLVFHTWMVFGRVAGGHCQAVPDTSYTSKNHPCMKNQRLPVQF